MRTSQIYPKPGEQDLNVTLKRINWISECYLLNTTTIEKGFLRRMKTIFLNFDESILKKQNVSVELKLQGQNLAAPRDIKDHIFYHSGDPMIMKLDKMLEFRVKIKKKVFFEGEPGSACHNYPNSEFESYGDCDHKFMKTSVEEISPGLVPVWMTEDLSKVTTEPVVASMNEASKFNSMTAILFNPRCYGEIGLHCFWH